MRRDGITLYARSHEVRQGAGASAEGHSPWIGGKSSGASVIQ
jgi:hypothetical protein